MLTVVLPGAVLWRMLTGGRTVGQDLGFGAVLGLAWALGVWAVFTSLGRLELQLVRAPGAGVGSAPTNIRRHMKPDATALLSLDMHDKPDAMHPLIVTDEICP